MTNDEMNLSKIHFYQKTRFPGVIGCIDGTHVRIIAPKKNLQHLYLNRKGYYSLNVMIVCDYKMNVRFVDSRYSGANHDSFVYNLSEYKEMLNELDENTFILGDAGYPLEKHLMTPFRLAESGSAESRFNTIHAQTRNIIERTIGVIKSKFRCLLSARGLHYSPERAAKFVNASCALHNISQHFKVVYVGEIQNDDAIDSNDHDVNDFVHGVTESRAREIRNNIMNSF
ncbi:putative nuclease HARBI1 [Eupeodes corollae]|uniref:putative nuclease HARBI1 n=1 Tax=Eupeodes corollae TaxID=290404 RepID=UPI002491F2E6|nr:putative nuclease HARBI1 [Eupeodes corollae]